MIVSSVGTHGRIAHMTRPPPKRPLTVAKIFTEMYQTLADRSFVALFIAAMLGAVATGLSASLTFYFTTYFWGFNPGQIGLVVLGVFLSAVLGATIAPIVSRHMGKKRGTMIIGLIAFLGAALPIVLRLIGDRLAGKRVGIIGTGATAIQCVPPLAQSAGHLFVFQRTPSSVDARDNSPTDAAWAASLQPGWQQARIENFTAQFTSELPAEDLVHDGWTVLARAVREKLTDNPEGLDPGSALEQADFEKMAQIRERIGSIVKDSATAEALKPWFSLYCKRPCFSDLYLQAFNQPNVTLVATGGHGVDRITPTGIVVGETDYPLDCLIFATGFDVATSYAKRSGMTIHGVGRLSLTDKWSGGPSTLHGMHTRGFPNCFVISQAQSGMSPKFPHMLSEQTHHLAHIVEHCLANGVATIEPTADAEGNWVETIVRMGEARRKFIEACTPGYYNNEGRTSTAAARSGVFGAGPIAFVRLLREWREQGDLAGMELNGDHARNKETSR